MIRELPPFPAGSAEQQLSQLRDYLVRLVGSLDEAERGASGAERSLSALQEQNARAVKDTAASLKALLIKTADRIGEQTDRKLENFRSLYVARSDFGSYYNAIETQVEQTARQTVESYRYTEAVEALDRFVTELGGQIRRGAIEDPATHEVHLGIAISETLSFTGETVTEGGVTYEKVSPGQTLGLYTSTGWQFWINGVRRGWFSSEDSMLHVSNIAVEELLRLGADWQISTSGGFGLRFVGG